MMNDVASDRRDNLTLRFASFITWVVAYFLNVLSYRQQPKGGCRYIMSVADISHVHCECGL